MLKNLLTLTVHESILDNLTLKEPINTDILIKLINSDLLKKSFKNPLVEFFYCNEKDQLEDYKNLIKDDKAYVTYKKPEGMKFGRSNPIKGLGLFCLRREIRHTLTKNKYVDIDIKNCHPVILLQICKDNIIDCEELNIYINNRDEIINEIMIKYNVSYDDVKKLFIRLLYFGTFKMWADEMKIQDKPTNYINRFITEITQIGEIIANKNPEIKKLIIEKKKKLKEKDFNIIGSTIAYYLQEIESRILERIYKYCINRDIIKDNEAVLCADGLMILKENYKDDYLLKFNKLIKKHFNLDLIFIKKDINMDYLDILDNHLIFKDNILDVDFSISQLREYFDSDIQTYKNKLINNFHHTTAFKYFNNYHAYFYLVDGVYKIFNSEIIPYKKFNNTFKEIIYKEEIENGKIKEYKFTDLFDKCIYKRQYSTFDFEPNKKICDDKFNLFLGFKYDDNKIKFDINKINHFLNHIKFICSDNDEVYKYFISWMAHIIQKPEIKTKVALVLYSIIEGVGKNIIFDIFGELLNGYNAKFTNTEAIGEKFNSDLMGKLFVIGDEVKGRKTDIMNELKDIITRLEENIELKGKDKFKIHDYKNYAFTTNNENIFKISSSDRRFMLIECPEVKKDNEYYKLLFDMILDKETLKHLHFYLKHYDLTNFNPMNIITTDYKKNIILCNIPPYIKFLKDNFASYENDQFTALDLYNKSLEYARVNKMNSTYSEQLFYKQFKKVFGKYYCSGRSVYYNFICNIDDINKCIEDNLI